MQLRLQTANFHRKRPGLIRQTNLALQRFCGVAEQHEREVVVDAVNGAVGQDGDHAADVGEHPHDADVELAVRVRRRTARLILMLSGNE